MKSEIVTEIENPYKPYTIQHNLPPRIGTGSFTTCNIPRSRLHNISQNKQAKTKYQIWTDLNCDSVNVVVYLITCNLFIKTMSDKPKISYELEQLVTSMVFDMRLIPQQQIV